MSDDFYAQENGRAALVEMLQTAGGDRRERQALRHIDCVWLNGELIPSDEATVQVQNPALRYGPGVFEGIGCYETERGPALFRPEAHLTRFLQRVRLFGVNDLRFDLVALRRAAHVTVQVNNFTSCYVQPILYFTGAGGTDLDSYEPAVAVTASGWDSDAWQEAASSTARRRGIRLMVTGARGPQTDVAGLRSAARGAGFDEAVLLDERDRVAGCTAETLFLLRDGVLYTLPQSDPIPGVARDTLITLASDLGYEVREAPLARDDLFGAEELFVCNTVAEVAPVHEIDDRVLADSGVGPVTARLQQLYADTVRGRGRRSRGWLEYVMMEPLF